MAKFKVGVEGDTKEELVDNLKELLELLGAEGGEESGGEEGGDEGGEEGGDEEDLLGGDGDEEEPDLREGLKPIIVKMSKHAKGPDKIRAIFKAAKANRLQDVDDKMLKKVDAAIRKAAKELKIKID